MTTAPSTSLITRHKADFLAMVGDSNAKSLISLRVMKRRTFVWTSVVIAAHVSVLAAAPQRVAIAGINNFWRVDDTISTGGTITSREMAVPELKRRGIRSVINLAGGADAEAERAAVEAAGMKYFLFPIDPMALDRAPVDPLLKAMPDPTNVPVFVHSGAGPRAAAVLMLKRVRADGWNVEKA